MKLATGAELRVTGTVGECAVVCVNGGQHREVEGTWSPTVEWLVERLAPRLPELAFAEVRYRVKSWRRFDECVADGAAALAEARSRGAEKVALLGFSMGGAVAARIAADDVVTTVIGLAPWLPPQLELDALAGRRVAILHGALDAPLPGMPGVRPSISLEAAERARVAGADVERTVIPGAVHAIALRSPRGALVPMPRARRWAQLVGAELERFCA